MSESQTGTKDRKLMSETGKQKPMEATRNRETEKTIHDLGEAVRDAEAALKTGASESAEKGHELRARLLASIEKAKVVCGQLQEKTINAAKATDKAVHEHPYQAVGIAFAVGLLVGVLAARNRHESA
jgi:ElaB/YqjD/DUF883 family membrane-anchored ribosome-binding protein